MKLSIFLNLLFLAQICSAENLLLKADLDPREITLPEGSQLWSDTQAENIKNRLLRDDIMTSSSLYLENRISFSDFIQLLQSWSDYGFNQQERIVLADTIQKSKMPDTLKNQWLCRLDLERNCTRIKIFSKHLSPFLQKYDWLVIDGQVYPRMAWDEIFVSNENMTWTFLSSRFETYTFKGKWEDLKLKNPMLSDWVSGNCDHFTVLNQVQALDTNVLINRNCMKSSLVKPSRDPSFYEKNKKNIWLAAGLILGVGAFNTLNGQKIIIDKPSYK